MEAVSKVIELSALPANEWRTLCSCMAYYARHREDVPHPVIDRHFPHERPDLSTWTFIRKAVTAVRLAVEEAAVEGKQLSRNEYMRLYMKRLRLKKANGSV